MTYCVAVKLDAGLVFLSDSRTNAGLDQIGTFRKMMIYERPGDRFMVMLSAGNLSISQQVREILQIEELHDGPTVRRSRSGTRPACSTPRASSARRCAASTTRTARR
jgi:predicted proteasome-type protease